jgi:dTDP-4-dehydrorhamnose reductase
MKHLIVGAGNLGLALQQRVNNSRLVSASTGMPLPASKADLIEVARGADVVWLPLGAGSVGEVKKDYPGALELHFNLVRELQQMVTQRTRIVAFSTDYAANENRPFDRYLRVEKPRSLYAQTKVALEDWARSDRPENLSVVRVGSLYGSYKPQKCFPHRLQSNFSRPTTLSLPCNRVIPTPVDWLAQVLTENLEQLFDGYPIHHAAPQGSVSVAEWGQVVLGSDYTVNEGPEDFERPLYSNLGCSFQAQTPTWKELWDKHN